MERVSRELPLPFSLVVLWTLGCRCRYLGFKQNYLNGKRRFLLQSWFTVDILSIFFLNGYWVLFVFIF